MTNDNLSSLDFLHSYCQFEQPNHVWVLTGIVRNKDNGDSEHNKWMRRLIIRSPEDIESCYNDIKAMGNIKGVTYRMYCSLNARDVTKALFSYQRTLLDIGYDLFKNCDITLDHIKRMDSAWKTELLQTSNRATKRFLLDIDLDNGQLMDGILAYLETITTVRAIRKTVSGYHIVFDACDTRELMSKWKDYPIDLQRDSLLFVETWEGERMYNSLGNPINNP